jgi:hypothetical protein
MEAKPKGDSMLSTAIKAQPGTSAQLEPKFADIAAAMSFTELDAMIASGIDAYKGDYAAMVNNKERLRVFVTEMRERLSAQGKRTDLPDTPKGLTWQKWVESKKKAIGSLSTIKRLLADPTEKSKKTLWKDLIDRLEILLPTVEDGTEHVIVDKLETGILRVQAGEKADPRVALLCQRIGANFTAYAQLLDPAAVADHPDVLNAEKILRQRLNQLEQEQFCAEVV